MRLLLDTQILLWLMQDSDRLGPQTRSEIFRAEIVYVSVVSIWEAVTKAEEGRLSIPDSFANEVTRSGLKILDINLEHAAGIPQAILPHRDPFDRMLLSQAHHEQLALVTEDEVILAKYGIGCVDARK